MTYETTIDNYDRTTLTEIARLKEERDIAMQAAAKCMQHLADVQRKQRKQRKSREKREADQVASSRFDTMNRLRLELYEARTTVAAVEKERDDARRLARRFYWDWLREVRKNTPRHIPPLPAGVAPGRLP